MRQERLTIKLTPSLWGLSGNTDPASDAWANWATSRLLHDMSHYRLEKESHYDHLHIYLPQTSREIQHPFTIFTAENKIQSQPSIIY